MNSFSVAFLFIVQLGLLLGLLWLWWRVKDRLQDIESRAAESLDGQDLIDFQERITGLLSQVKEAGSDLVALIDERRAGLDREATRARDAEKRLAEKIKSFERVEEKARKRLDDWVSAQAKKASIKPGKTTKKTLPAAPPAAAGVSEPENVDAGSRPLKVTYLKRDFRPPEAQAPASPAGRYLKVYEMADEGRNREEIARACGYLPGEVELILNLRPRPRG